MFFCNSGIISITHKPGVVSLHFTWLRNLSYESSLSSFNQWKELKFCFSVSQGNVVSEYTHIGTLLKSLKCQKMDLNCLCYYYRSPPQSQLMATEMILVTKGFFDKKNVLFNFVNLADVAFHYCCLSIALDFFYLWINQIRFDPKP